MDAYMGDLCLALCRPTAPTLGSKTHAQCMCGLVHQCNRKDLGHQVLLRGAAVSLTPHCSACDSYRAKPRPHACTVVGREHFARRVA